MSRKRRIGVDLSKWNGVIDYTTFAPAGIEFVYIKCANGAGGVDPLFKANWQASKGVIPRGAYLWFTDEDPFAQADHIIKVLQDAGDMGELSIAVDFEEPSTKYRGTVLLDRLRICLARIHAVTGRPPKLYTGNWYWQGYVGLDAQDIVEAYPLWLAQYPRLHIDNPRQCGVDPPVLPKPNCPTPWATRALDPETWQFDGDHGCVLPSGVDADFNEYLGDDFDAFCGVEAMPETMPGADANPFPLNMSIQESNGDSGKTS